MVFHSSLFNSILLGSRKIFVTHLGLWKMICGAVKSGEFQVTPIFNDKYFLEDTARCYSLLTEMTEAGIHLKTPRLCARQKEVELQYRGSLEVVHSRSSGCRLFPVQVTHSSTGSQQRVLHERYIVGETQGEGWRCSSCSPEHVGGGQR